MTQMAMRFPYPSTSVSAEAPLRWRLRGAAMAAAFVVGSATASGHNPPGYADRGVASTPATAEPLWTAPSPADPASTWADEPVGAPATAALLHGAITGTSRMRGFVYRAETGTLRDPS
ncbi:hypothetical protein OHA21_04490 [Actinoplanes sp. NBC_00393]|uniref:hypothetical protein n=1 Tax=Actinoplanes sp. NBC_00393 TaxID=2975953 RepID=UPI002E1F714E